MGVVSTRTPEGEPANCPICGGRSFVVPSAFPTPDVPCPWCGTLLWVTGGRGRDAGGQVCVGEVIAEMEAAIRRGAERLRELQSASLVEEPVRAELRIEEITDPVAIRTVEGQLAAGA
jgi:hypothetical protein